MIRYLGIDDVFSRVDDGFLSFEALASRMPDGSGHRALEEDVYGCFKIRPTKHTRRVSNV